MSAPRLCVGIDLGTTHCALATADAEGDDAPRALPLPQVVAPGEVDGRALLPSFLFFPAAAQFAKDALALPWYPSARDVVGSFARSQGARTPGRLVASAKSWLSHSGVDRRAEILPVEAPQDVPRVSPLQASARYLAHLRAAWDEAHPDDPLEDQDVVLTVPASFDAVARELTAEAAELAGFAQAPVLLEEPQAALYDWVAQRGDAWRDDVTVGDIILVVDIGGGTTDFSLIEVCDHDGSLALERIAVGDHILLGGDNMDLALAYVVQARLEDEGKDLDEWQLRALTHAVRGAKETLLQGDQDEVALSIPSRGSKLVGGTIRATLTKAEVWSMVLDGFFPMTDAHARPQKAERAGLTALGLPYAADAAVTRHLAAFLGGAREEHPAGHSFVHPTAVLFNGGVTRAPSVREKVLEVLGAWVTAEGGRAPSVLEGVDPELAVARGAAYYARARRSGGLRIRGGLSQSYYIGIERAELAVPGVPPRMDAVCVAPFGLEEGSEVELQRTFGIVLGEPVSFRFFGSPTRHDALGTKAPLREVSELAPIQTTLDGEAGTVVEVRLRVRATEVGTLDIEAVPVDPAVADTSGWALRFDVRGAGA
ncbi:MAG: Hsp70 family protein [Nannocystaceae bacterium]|nr:Hsp70 family protein [bacterium]